MIIKSPTNIKCFIGESENILTNFKELHNIFEFMDSPTEFPGRTLYQQLNQY